MEELIKKHSDLQQLIDKTIMEIGQKYSIYVVTKDKSLIEKINGKVELCHKLEKQMQIVEEEMIKINN